MSIKIKNIIIFSVFYFFITSGFGNENLKSIGKFKDWEVFTLQENENKVCFLQSSPVLQAPKKVERESRFFVTFRPSEKIMDEVSVTAGYKFNSKNEVRVKSGKNIYKLFSQENFAWLRENRQEKKLIKVMKKGSRIMITGYNQSGSQTIDHYSLMGFTKAYNLAKKSCS